MKTLYGRSIIRTTDLIDLRVTDVILVAFYGRFHGSFSRFTDVFLLLVTDIIFVRTDVIS